MIALYYLWGEGDSYLVDEMIGVFESLEQIPEKIRNAKFKNGEPSFFINPTEELIEQLRRTHGVGYYGEETCFVIRDYNLNDFSNDWKDWHSEYFNEYL